MIGSVVSTPNSRSKPRYANLSTCSMIGCRLGRHVPTAAVLVVSQPNSAMNPSRIGGTQEWFASVPEFGVLDANGAEVSGSRQADTVSLLSVCPTDFSLSPRLLHVFEWLQASMTMLRRFCPVVETWWWEAWALGNVRTPAVGVNQSDEGGP